MPEEKRIKLVLIGGGHSHAIALKEWSQRALHNVEITLITDVENTPYSGMLPGYVAGFYSYKETHINLPNLARIAGAKLIIDRAISLDLDSNKVICQHHESIDFDYLSINVGSTPKTATVPGAAEYAIAAKPVPLFLKAWNELLENVKRNPQHLFKITIIGGGAGGVELALNMHSRFQKIEAERQSKNIAITLVHRGDKLLSEHNQKVSQLLNKILQQKQIGLHLNTEVTAITPKKVICNQQKIIESDYTFWVTQADSPQWIKNSNLALDNKGFVVINNNLQSLSHPHIFATGDIATIKNYSRPKAGVFAVRQGQPLYNNWLNIIGKQPLETYVPQKKYLALIGTGDKKAIALWGNFCWYSWSLWYLKDYIDRQFMKQFET